MKDSIAIIDDDKDFLTEISQVLSGTFNIYSFNCPVEFQNSLDSDFIKKVSAIVVDLEMPAIDGMSLIQIMRERFLSIPTVIVLTHHNTERRRLSAYSSQVADFIGKDIRFKEIGLRVQNSIDLYKSKNVEEFFVKGLYYNSDIMGFVYNKEELPLTKLETKILYALSVQLILPVEKGDVVNRVWGDQIVSGQTLRTHLYNLNKKIKELGFAFSIADDGKVHIVRKAWLLDRA